MIDTNLELKTNGKATAKRQHTIHIIHLAEALEDIIISWERFCHMAELFTLWDVIQLAVSPS
jgi:hypothetical protein